MSTPAEFEEPEVGRVGKVKKILFVSAFVIAAVLLLAFGFIRYFAPGTYYALESEWNFWRAGVRDVRHEHFRGIERNLCKSESSTAATPSVTADSATAPAAVSFSPSSSSRCHCVLFIHGMGDSSATWRRIFLMDEDRFKEPVRLVAFDLPGMGETPLPEDPDELLVSRMGGHFQRWLQSNRCTEATVVGNSFGGWIALWTARHDYDPSQSESPVVKRVISLAGVGLRGVGEEDPFFAQLRREPTIERLKEFQRRAYHSPREYPESFWESALRRAQESRGPSVADAQNDEQYFNGEQWPEEFPSFEYYWGESDRIVPREMGEALIREVPNSSFHLIPKCGHLPQKECSEAVVDAAF